MKKLIIGAVVTMAIVGISEAKVKVVNLETDGSRVVLMDLSSCRLSKVMRNKSDQSWHRALYFNRKSGARIEGCWYTEFPGIKINASFEDGDTAEYGIDEVNELDADYIH